MADPRREFQTREPRPGGLKRKPVIDITVAPVDMWGDGAEHDRLRAQRVVEYIRHRFPAVRYDDALEDFDDRVRGRVLHETGKRKVI